jgi:nicotinamide-nucleotide amidase
MTRSLPPASEIITIGSELLLGQIVDTNTSYLAQELAQLGISVRFQTAVGDRTEEIAEVIKAAVERCDLVITTGGLGPTEDDLTREVVARVAGVDLEFRQDLMDQIEEVFRRYGYQMSENNRKQARVPQGSRAIPNPVGTAPAFIAEIDGKPVIALPGVPRELRYLLSHEVAPWLRERFHLMDNRVSYRVLKVVGLGESGVDRIIGDLMKEGENPEIGLLASPGEIRIRVAAMARDAKEADELIEPVLLELRARLGDKVLGEEDDTLESVVHGLLEKKAISASALETFTGGTVAKRLFGIPSGRVLGSVVSPHPGELSRWLGPIPSPLDQAGAFRMASLFREKAGADVSLAIIGFPRHADPGFSVEAHAAVVGRGIERYFAWNMRGDLPMLQERGAVIGLNTLRLGLLE